MLLFVLHVSGVAHLLSDVLLDDDMTCVDEQAHHPQRGSTAPQCPTAEGLGHGQGFAPPVTDLSITLPEGATVELARPPDARPPLVTPRSIERPPRV